MNTYKSVSKQRTLSPFRMNTDKKHKGGGVVMVNQESDKDSCPEEHRDEGSLFKSRKGSLPPAGYPESGLGRNGRRIDRRAGTFLQRMNRIDRQVFKAFHQSAGPAHLYPLDLGGGPEAKVKAHIAIGDVAGPAANFVNERARTGFHRDLRADSIAIGFAAARSRRKRRSNRPESNPMIAIANVVHQQHRRRIHVADDRGHPAVIPQISNRQSTSGTYRRNPRPRLGGNIGERSIAVVVIKNFRLLKITAEVLAVHFRVDVPVDQQQIGPAVIVHVKKHDAPPEILRVETESRGKSFVIKRAVAHIPVERGGIV